MNRGKPTPHPSLKILNDYHPPSVNDYLHPEKRPQNFGPPPDPKKQLYDEIFALDNLELEKKIKTDLAKQNVKSPSSVIRGNKRFRKHKATKKKYLYNFFSDELQNLGKRQNVRIVRNLVDYIRFYCPSHRNKFRLMDVEELLHYPFIIPYRFHNVLSLITSKDIPDKPPTFSSIPIYSSSIAKSALGRWRIPSKDVTIEDDMTRKLPAHRKETNTKYPTNVPNTAASNLSSTSKDPWSISKSYDENNFRNPNHLTVFNENLSNPSDPNSDELQLKYMLELIFRFQEYFHIVHWKPMKWFDIITSHKKDKFQQNLYYNEFYYGIMKFCKEMNLIYFKEYEIELIFQYFVRISLWTTFIESLKSRKEIIQQKLQEFHQQGMMEMEEEDIELPPQTIFPYIRRHDFKVGLKKLQLSNKRIIWLNHQAQIFHKCSHYVELFNISLYHYSMEIMKGLYGKDNNNNKNSSNNAESPDNSNPGSANNSVTADFSLEEDNESVISATTLQNMKNLQSLEDKIINIHELESMVSKLVNDVMVFTECKDVNKVLQEYYQSKHLPGGGGGEWYDEDDDNSSVISDLSGNSLEIRRQQNNGKKRNRNNHKNSKKMRKQQLVIENAIRNVGHLADANNLDELSTRSIFDDLSSQESSQASSLGRQRGRNSNSNNPSRGAPSSKQQTPFRLTPLAIHPENTAHTPGLDSDRAVLEDEFEEKVPPPLAALQKNPDLVSRRFSVNPVLLQSKTYSSKNLLSSPIKEAPNLNDKDKFPFSSSTRFENNSNSNTNGGKSPMKGSLTNTLPSGSALKKVPSTDKPAPPAANAPIQSPGPALSKQKSVKLNLGTQTMNGTIGRPLTELEELSLTYMTGEFRNTQNEYNFEPSRPPSKGIYLSEAAPTPMHMSRSNSRVGSFIKSRSASQDDIQSVASNTSISKRTSSKDDVSIEELSNRHYLIRRYSIANISAASSKNGSFLIPPELGASPSHQNSALLGLQANSPKKLPISLVPGTNELSVSIKDPALENPSRFYQDYKNFEVKMREDRDKHLSYYNSITTNFDRRISLARNRLNQLQGIDK
jgi:hypothetical protein